MPLGHNRLFGPPAVAGGLSAHEGKQFGSCFVHIFGRLLSVIFYATGQFIIDRGHKGVVSVGGK